MIALRVIVMGMAVKLSTHRNHSFHMGSCTTVPRVINRSATRGMTGPCAAHFSCSTQSDRCPRPAHCPSQLLPDSLFRLFSS